MPALSLSLINAVPEPVSLPDPDLVRCLAAVPDPRRPRGVRHSLMSLLMTSVAAVLAGARSFTAIGEWAADAPPQVMAALGIRRDPLTGRFEPPGEATIRRVLEAVDADALDAAVGSWLAARAAGQAGHGRRRAVAVDGKSLRGTRHCAADGQAAHLLAVADQRTGAVLSQRDVDGKTNEITRFAPLLEDLNLAGQVVTADALHTQRETAEFVVTGKNAHYILVVKKNQPGLHARIRKLPWKDIPPGHSQDNRGHGREERRDLKVTAVAAGLGFPCAARAIRLTRRVRPLSGARKWKTTTIYAITSLNAAEATPAELAGWIRGHWRIEALHHIRDVTYGEDASQARTGNGPRAMAAVRNLAIGALKTAGHPNIAAASRQHARDATQTIATLGLTPARMKRTLHDYAEALPEVLIEFPACLTHRPLL